MLALDHIVIAGNNAEVDSISYYKQYAIKSLKGGEHDNWGTYNYLAYLSNDSYIEWLGIRDYDKAKNSDNPLIQHLVYVLDQNKPGPFQFALRTNHMDDYVKHFQENNIPFKGPFPGQRQRPDGSILKWRMLFPTYDYKSGMLPFLIEWGNTPSVSPLQDLTNSQVIKRIVYNGVDKNTFTTIYQLNSNTPLHLQNTKITFTKKENFSFILQ